MATKFVTPRHPGRLVGPLVGSPRTERGTAHLAASLVPPRRTH